MSNLFPPFHWTNLLIIPGLLIGYTVHELAHALVAYFLGDHSQVERGKITLNPFRHISWFGTFAFLLFGIGWPKPMETDSQHFKQRHLAMFLIAIAGPLASFTLSLIGLLLTLLIATLLVHNSGATTDEVFAFLFPGAGSLPESMDWQAWAMASTSYIAIASFWLTFTSLLPLPGLDGFSALMNLYFLVRDKNQTPEAVRAHPKRTNPLLLPIEQQRRRSTAANIHFKVGTDYHLEHDYDDAIARYRQAIANDQHFGPAYVNLGLAYLAKSRRREAIRAFRGAVQYADDQKSQQEAWFQLHQLSEVSSTDETSAQASLVEMGAAPWTDTKPRPNWVGLGVSGGLLLIGSLFFYGYLLTSLIEILQA